MTEHVNEKNSGEWSSERILRALETGVNGLRAALTRTRQYFSMPGPSDEFLNQGTTTPPNNKPVVDPGNRFNSPFL